MELNLWYTTPAENSDKGWERQSLPLGCGHFGANVFGIPHCERIQITENSLENTFRHGGLNNMAEVFVQTDHDEYTNYKRGLCLDHAVAWCNYTSDTTSYQRESFASYPDRCFVTKWSASAPTLNCKVKMIVPFVKDYDVEPGDGFAKSGQVVANGDTLTMTGLMQYYDIRFATVAKVLTDGILTACDNCICIQNATWMELRLTCATNYVMCHDAFYAQPKQKTDKTINPLKKATKILQDTLQFDYTQLKQRHFEDYHSLFGRVQFELDGAQNDLPTDQLLQKYSQGEFSPYLEMLYFQFGRYLLISSSRKNALPPNLQGVWNCHDHAPWGSGYWHNINIQMNYWPVFNTNLAECFDSYSDFNETFRKGSSQYAREHLLKYMPRKRLEQMIRRSCPQLQFDDVETLLDNLPFEELEKVCGWTVGTGIFPYSVEGPGGHSGPGTAGLTSKIFADRYYFTQDKQRLLKSDLPIVQSLSRFYTKVVDDYDGALLATFSASPEQFTGEVWNNYYHTVGCAFDQQMIYENGLDFLNLAKAVGLDDVDVQIQQEQIDKYQPVLIGKSAHVKEFREENYYGDIGEYNHRHLSQLVGLFPGTQITKCTPAWMDAAKVSLNERTDQSTGWALAHRLCCWARTGDGNRTYKLLNNLLGQRTLPNLWDNHPPFQIDGNFGGTAGIAEMLLQSHENCVEILPALPDAWASGRFDGLVARGNFAVGASWKNGVATQIEITSQSGNKCILKYPNLSKAQFNFDYQIVDQDTVCFDTEVGVIYVAKDIPPCQLSNDVQNLRWQNGELCWDKMSDATFDVTFACDNDKTYTLLKTTTKNCLQITLPDACDHVVLRVVAKQKSKRPSNGARVVIAK